MRAVGTASAFAATNLVGERLVQNRTLKALPNAPHFANLEAARAALDKTSRASISAASVPAVTPAKTLVKAAIAAPRAAAGQVLARALTSSRMLKSAGAIGAVVGIGALAAQTDAGRAAIAQVKGFFRRHSTTGRTPGTCLGDLEHETAHSNSSLCEPNRISCRTPGGLR